MWLTSNDCVEFKVYSVYAMTESPHFFPLWTSPFPSCNNFLYPFSETLPFPFCLSVNAGTLMSWWNSLNPSCIQDFDSLLQAPSWTQGTLHDVASSESWDMRSQSHKVSLSQHNLVKVLPPGIMCLCYLTIAMPLLLVLLLWIMKGVQWSSINHVWNCR